jgi:hypothetical protein
MLYNADSELHTLKEASVRSRLCLRHAVFSKNIKEQVGGLIKAEEWQRLRTEAEWKQQSLSDF